MNREDLGRLAALVFLLSAVISSGCSQDDPPAAAAEPPQERASVDPTEAEMIEQLGAIGYVAESQPTPAKTFPSR